MPKIKKSYKILVEDPALKTACSEYLNYVTYGKKSAGFFASAAEKERVEQEWLDTCSNYRETIKNHIRNIYPEFVDGTYEFGAVEGYSGFYVIQMIRELEVLVG